MRGELVDKGRRFRLHHLWGYAAAIGTTGAGTALILGVTHLMPIANASLLYIPAILGTALYFGTWPSLLAAGLAVLEYDFFLLAPTYTLTIAQPQDVLAFAIFLLIAVMTSRLAAKSRTQAETARLQAAESMTLYELSSALTSTNSLNHVLDAITRQIVKVFDVTVCAIFVPGAGETLELAAQTTQGLHRRSRASKAAALWSFQHSSGVGVPDEHPGAQRLYIPLQATERVVGVMEVGPRRSGFSLDDRQRRLVSSFAAQASLVILRTRAEEERSSRKTLEESDRLKSALLSAVSHDLRTPLANIKAAATTLLLAGVPWTEQQGRECLWTIDRETDRLNRLVGNLLDISRIEAGVLRPALEWYDIREVVSSVVDALQPILGDRSFVVDIQPNMPSALLDLVRVEELVANLLENALKYAPIGSSIELRAWCGSAGLYLSVADHGPGVPASRRENIFETFYRQKQHTDADPGLGLGLAICRGIATAHGGAIHVEETDGGGATFVLSLPPSLLAPTTATP